MSGSSLPAHASPAYPPLQTPQPSSAERPHPPTRDISELHLDHLHAAALRDARQQQANHDNQQQSHMPSIISPAYTPPSTPGGRTAPALSRDASSAPLSAGAQQQEQQAAAAAAAAAAASPQPPLVDQLPEVSCVVRARIPTTSGQEMFLHVYSNKLDSKEHLAIVFGNSIRSRSLDAPRPGETERDRMIRGAYVGRLYPGRTSSRIEQIKREECVAAAQEELEREEQEQRAAADKSPLVRIHSECYTGETVWSARCDCGEQLDEAARLMSLPQSGGGVIIYLRQEGRGIGLAEKLKAYNLQDLGNDTYEANLLLRHPADARSYGLATAMLVDLGLGGEKGIRLLTNNPDKIRAIEGPNREVVVKERVAMVPLAWRKGQKGSEEVEKYLSTKIEKFKHLLSPDQG